MSFKSMLRIIKFIYELPVLAWDVKVYFIVNQMLFYSLELDQVVDRNWDPQNFANSLDTSVHCKIVIFTQDVFER